MRQCNSATARLCSNDIRADTGATTGVLCNRRPRWGSMHSAGSHLRTSVTVREGLLLTERPARLLLVILGHNCQRPSQLSWTYVGIQLQTLQSAQTSISSRQPRSRGRFAGGGLPNSPIAMAETGPKKENDFCFSSWTPGTRTWESRPGPGFVAWGNIDVDYVYTRIRENTCTEYQTPI